MRFRSIALVMFVGTGLISASEPAWAEPASSTSETIEIFFGVLALAFGIMAIYAALKLTDWEYSQMAGWCIVATIAMTVYAAVTAPPFAHEAVFLVGWGFSMIAALLTRIAGHVASLATTATRSLATPVDPYGPIEDLMSAAAREPAIGRSR